MLRRRSLLTGAGALLNSACAAQTAAPRATLPPARPISLEAPVGAALRPLGGLRIDPAVLGFGGLSGLHLSEDLEVTAISDVARWMRARLVLEDGRPMGLANLRTGRLRDGAGQPLQRGFSGDAESLAGLPDGTWLVGFERWHRIRRYPTLDAAAQYLETPAELAEAPGNGGLESLAVLPDGRWLLIAEQWEAPDGGMRAWLGRPGAWTRLAYLPEAPMQPVDCAPLPGGGALVLERSFSVLGGFRGRLTRLTAAQISAAREGTLLVGETLLRLQPPLPTDNYEGVSAARIGGRTLVALVSDDNQTVLQQTLLLLFELAE